MNTLVPMVVILLLAAAAARAQESRTGAIEQQQSEKVKALTPEGPGRLEQIVVGTKNDLLVSPSGFYPTFDSVYSGGGFTAGVGYRRYYADTTFWNAQVSYSIKGYKHVMLNTTSHSWLRGRLDFGAHAGWRDATQVEYFGLGTDTSPDAVANFRLQETYAGGMLRARPLRWMLLAGGVDYESFIDKTGEGPSPSIEQAYTPATAPALGEDPSYLHFQGTAGIDTRTSPGYSRVGGYYGATLHAWTGLEEAGSFEHLQLDAIQHFPILRETWVLSLRGRMVTTLGDDDVVPYFLSASLGGGHTLRAYSSNRFRDRHSLLASAEWRWIPSYDGLDMAIFYDAGEVTSRRADLDFEGWKHNWGVGARFHGPLATPLRIEMARGSEGWQLVFAGSAAF